MNSAEIAFPNIGFYIPHLPKGITIGGFTIAFYGMIIAAGMLSGLWLACHQAQRTGQKKEVYTDFAIYAIIFPSLVRDCIMWYSAGKTIRMIYSRSLIHVAAEWQFTEP